jgi:hypothetical protein
MVPEDPMKVIVDWLKQNRLLAALLIVIAYLLFQNTTRFYGISSPRMSQDFGYETALKSPAMDGRSFIGIPEPINDVPPTDSSKRLVITDTNLSLLVNDVAQTLKQIQSTAESFGGFLVNSSLGRPEGAAYGTITVRVPSDKREAALEAYRGYSVKVVSESVYGNDVTDQYEDITSKLATLNQTKSKFEAMLAEARNVNETLQVQRELITLQNQIDQLVGRQAFLAKSAELSRITIDLSTDELALPYAPDQAWRPQVVLKQAIRSLVGSLRQLGDTAIWLAVYSVIWLPILLIILWWRKRQSATIAPKTRTLN